MFGTTMANTEMKMSRATFKRFKDLIYEKAGIALNDKKYTLVSTRLAKRLRKRKLTDYTEYFDVVAADESGVELTELLNVISTNTTHFFREARHFEILTEIMSKWEKEGQTRFRLWCAAASTGQEPYTIAMTLAECMQSLYDVKLLATDISTKVLGTARDGLYRESALDTVSRHLQRVYFTKTREQEAGEPLYAVNDELKRLITFGRINLSTPPFPLKGPLDVIFCRNVMIYFDNEVRRRLLADCYRLLKPGGYLMVGHAESLSSMLSNFQTVEPSVYVKA